MRSKMLYITELAICVIVRICQYALIAVFCIFAFYYMGEIMSVIEKRDCSFIKEKQKSRELEELIDCFSDNRQVGGNHYSRMGEYSPWNVMERWRNPDHMRGFLLGDIIAYLERYPYKGGVDDLRKARHTLDKLIKFECKVSGLPEINNENSA